jgi:adenosylmethionine-8-amino-7-oxononanoate aminotransferase
MALEIVRDRQTKEVFDPSLKLHARIKSLAMENGLMVE